MARDAAARQPIEIGSPAGLQPPGLVRLTRRQFLGSAAAAPVAITSGGKSATAEEADFYTLILELVEDGSVLLVTERAANATPAAAPADAKEKVPTDVAVDREALQWRVPAAAFGPHAWFDMERPAGEITKTAAPPRRIHVRNCRFGGLEGVTVIFRFTREGRGKEERWYVELVQSPLGEGSGAAIRFAAFLKGQTVRRTLPTDAIERNLKSMFDSGVALAARRPPAMELQMNRDMVFTVASPQPSLTILGGHVAMSAFAFSWRQNDGSARPSGAAKNANATQATGDGRVRPGMVQPKRDGVFFLGLSSGKIHWPVGRIAIGRSNEHHVDIIPHVQDDHDKGATPLAFGRIGPSAAIPGRMQTVVGVHVPRAETEVMRDNERIAGLVRADNIVVTRTILPDRRQTRTAVWGDVLGGDPGKNEKVHLAGVSRIDSPIGMLLVGPPASETLSDKLPGGGAPAASEVGGAATKPEEGGAGAGASSKPSAPAPEPSAAKAALQGVKAEPQGSKTALQGAKVEPQGAEAASPDPGGATKRLFQAALGDRGGAREATLFAVYDSRAGLRRVSIDLTLFEAAAAPADVSYSRLQFDAGDLRLFYSDGAPIAELTAGEYPLAPASSYVWLARNGQPRARLDLSRATLTCARDYDLMRLAFSFHDLALTIGDRGQTVIHSARETPRVLVRHDGSVEDSRPVLVVTFDPQHVMEEAILRPEPPPLPDVVESIDKDFQREAVLAALGKAKTPAEKIAIRKNARDAKSKVNERFKRLADAFEGAAGGLPEDQRIYIGPYALDPDGMALARAMQKQDADDALRDALREAFKRVDEVYAKLAAAQPSSLPPVIPDPLPPPLPPGKPDTDKWLDRQRWFSNAEINETLLEQQSPFYGVFRSFWHDRLSRSIAAVRRPGAKTDELSDILAKLANDDLESLRHYYRKPNLPYRHVGLATQDKVYAALLGSFVEYAQGREPVKALVGARLSGSSRLAFRVNCAGVAGLDAEEAGLPHGSPARADQTADGGVVYQPIPFTFEALTDWSHHEPAVSRRAQKLFTALPTGVLPPLGNRAANASDQDILSFQGFTPGPISAAMRLSEIRHALLQKPSELETAIELPSRVILSTAQDAIWLCDRRLPPEVIRASGECPVEVPTSRPALGLESGAAAPKLGQLETVPRHDIWAARLDVPDAPPSLRVIDSPDLRPSAVGGLYPDGQIRVPNQAAPPRGPYAPWFIGAEQFDSRVLASNDVENDVENDSDKKHSCDEEATDAISRLFRWICGREKARAALPEEDFAIFRTSLDAFDRHQLVLLSSAYGLPVTGARIAIDKNDPKRSGGLVADSGQIEPGRFWLFDGTNDQAIYRPIPLNVQELSLTALGGSFLHDTTFKPAAGAFDLRKRQIFEGFSIERWQHDIVLGRDIRAEVVYKGYLFPLGHRASLIKLTERVFLRTDAGFKALLRQRLFLRVARPKKLYPAVGQPHGGRLWCGNIVTMVTTRTADIIDPTAGWKETSDGSGSIPIGRLELDVGLAFWPRTDITDKGVAQFEIDFDGAKTSLPLMFVDNMAATNKASLEKVIAHYNKVTAPRRQAAFNNQKLRYAPEKQPGQASFATDWVRLRAHGLVHWNNTSWTGDLTDCQITGALEGAEQPPFYPAMEVARIRISQAERFSGGQPVFVEAQYDGHYVRYGFAEERGGEAPTPDKPQKDDAKPSPAVADKCPVEAYEPQTSAGQTGNPQEVFLDLRSVVPLDMGSNGDRGAGLSRPNMRIVALGRKNGPLGADQTVWWDKAPDSTAVAPDDFAKELKTAAPTTKEIQTVSSNAATLVSLARYFDSSIHRPAACDEVTGLGAEPESRPVPLGEDLASRKEEIEQAINVVKAYFSQDAKLLGTIRLRTLMEFLGIGPDNLPVLKEVIDYGTAALQQADSAMADFASDVRTRVLSPLRDVVARLRAEWVALSTRLSLSPETTGVSVATLYPEIQAGLDQLEASLTAAIATEDVVELTSKVAETYESGRRLVRALEVAAAHPVERLEAAVGSAVQSHVQTLLQEYDQIRTFANQLGAFVVFVNDMSKSADAETIVAFVEKQLPDVVKITVPLPDALVLSPPNLPAALSRLAPDASDTVRQEVTKCEGFLTKWIGTVLAQSAVRPILVAGLDAVLKRKNVETAVTEQSQATLKEAEQSLVAALKKAYKSLNNIGDAYIQAALGESLVAWQNALVTRINAASTNLQIETAVLRVSITRALELYSAVVSLRDAIDGKDPATILGAIGRLMRDTYGIDIAASATQEFNDSANTLAQEAADRSLKIRDALFVANDKSILSKELHACISVQGTGANPQLPIGNDASIPVLKLIGAAITELKSARLRLDEVSAALPNTDELKKFPGMLEDAQSAFKKTSEAIAGAAPRTGLVGKLLELYCATAQSEAPLLDLPALKTDAHKTDDGKYDLSKMAAALAARRRAVDLALEKITEAAAAVLTAAQELAKISGDQFARVVKSIDDRLPTAVAAAINPRQSVEAAEKAVTAALVDTLNHMIAMAKDAALFAGQTVAAAIVAVDHAQAALNKALGSTDATFGPLHGALTKLGEQVAETEKLSPLPPTLTTLHGLLIEKAYGDETVEKVFIGRDSFYVRLARDLANVEAAAIAAVMKLKEDAKGFPGKICELLWQATPTRAAATQLSGIYDALVMERNQALAAFQKISILKESAERALLVHVEGSDKDGLQLDADLLKDVAAGNATNGDAAPQVRRRLAKFLSDWGTGQSAPLLIIKQVQEIANSVLRGDMLAVIDLAAFRDQIEDAIANLVPTRATLNYDFDSIITRSASSKDIFQPKLGSPFGIQVRTVVDLLARQPPSFTARGHFGPFTINLIGGLVDALKLRFGGAAFEMVGASKPRFDVLYENFEIGTDLAFAKNLQSFLTPKNGNGVFVQPSSRGAGIEAGYGINLGVIGVGATSFFNVTLNVSADLPFDNQESLFKVSLGRRLNPFSMSVLPFAGSGYFAVFAAASGVRGFEASFEFGGGGAIGFGPLQAMARIQVGVFVRILKENGRQTTTLYGTFFAGGTASIWIFSFSTSLYVRLGKADGGAMYGEAIYSFSFSLGICDYDYSVTAFRREPALGSGNQSQSPSGHTGALEQPNHLAAMINIRHGAQGKGAPRHEPAWPPAVESLAVDPLDDWATYRSYFDESLVKGLVPVECIDG